MLVELHFDYEIELTLIRVFVNVLYAEVLV